MKEFGSWGGIPGAPLASTNAYMQWVKTMINGKHIYKMDLVLIVTHTCVWSKTMINGKDNY